MSITDLDNLKNLPRLHFYNINSETIYSARFIDNIGKIKSKKQV